MKTTNSKERYEIYWDKRSVAPRLFFVAGDAVHCVGSGIDDSMPYEVAVRQATLYGDISVMIPHHLRWPGGPLTLEIGREIRAAIGDRAHSVVPLEAAALPHRGPRINARGGV